VPLLTDHGLSAASTTATLAIFGLATMSGRLLAGFLVDRIFAPYVATFFFLAPIAGFAFLANATGIAAGGRCGVDGNGARHRDRPDRLLVTRYFGQRSFGQIYGYFFMIFGLGSSFGRFLAGLIFDMAGSYNPALIGAALALVVAVILVNRLGAYLYPVQREIAPALAPAAAAF